MPTSPPSSAAAADDAGAERPRAHGGDHIEIHDNEIRGQVIGSQYNLHLPAAGLVVVAVLVGAALIFVNRQPRDDGSAPPPSPGAPATLVDARKADPCSLLDAEALADYGDTRIDRNYGEFDRCDVVVSDANSGHEVALVKLNFASTPATPDSQTPTKKFGLVTVAETRSDPDACLRNVRLADGNQVWIEATEIGSPAPGLCALAGAAAEHAASVLNAGPVPERPTPFPPDSLAHAHACELLDAAALAVIPGIDVQDSGFANWDCSWASTTADARVDVSFSQDNDLTDDGRPVRLGGRQSYVTPKDHHDHNCVVRVEHRTYTDADGEPAIELAMVAVDGPQPIKELCATAKTLATAVAKRLPEP